jgi:cobalt/nickel transport system permease protein
MHIPDGYIGPQTYGAGYAIMAPIWAAASRILKRTVSRKQIPMLALGAAFSFVVMFLNVPVMGRLTAHPVGAGLVAIVCGPWAACIAISAALAVQAVPFGDGGITTFGLNCLNMAVIIPFVSWGAWKLLLSTKPTPRRLWLASAAAGYIGIVAAAAAVGIEVGVQPMLSPRGMYLPYPVQVALPAMLIPHLLIVGPIEAVITAAAISYLYRTDPQVVASQPISVARRFALLALVTLLLVPLGLLLPNWFRAGAAWGEWGVDELKQMLGYVPHGIAQGSRLWHAPIPDYAVPGHEATPVSIVFVALAGTIGTAAVAYGVVRLIKRGGKDAAS